LWAGASFFQAFILPHQAKAEAIKKTGALLDKGKTNHENTKEKKHEKR
jgi:hypothetical protein